MMNVFRRNNSQVRREFYLKSGKPPCSNRLDDFIERIKDDMSTNMISEADGTSLIIMTTLLINMQSAT